MTREICRGKTGLRAGQRCQLEGRSRLIEQCRGKALIVVLQPVIEPGCEHHENGNRQQIDPAPAYDYSLSAPGGGEGRGEVGDSCTLTETHLTLPSLRDGPLPLRPEGRRGISMQRLMELISRSFSGLHRCRRDLRPAA